MSGLYSTSTRRTALAGVGLALGLLSNASAEARGRHHHVVRHAVAHSVSTSAGGYGSNYAALVVDANTGRSLYAINPDALRHPASITKVMTLYLLFEKLDQGEISLSTHIPVSRHAASQSPTKLGLRPGSTIAVEDAIKAIVTRSANDMAVAVAEAVGGDEDSFARMMTRKAHALGMSRTTYVNASGLPDDRQITTARDLTVLGRAIQDRFPNYYRFFSTTSFTYAGQVIANHNHLMSQVEGMDGIKTGYTNASGFNLLSNVHRDGHHIVSVVMGGKSAAGRDRIMQGLIAEYIEEAAPTRTAAAIEERSPIEAPAATVTASAAEPDADPAKGDADQPHDTSPSLIAPTMAVPVPPRPLPRPAVAAARTEKPRPAFVAGATHIDTDRLPGPMSAEERRRATSDGSTAGRATPTSSPAVALVTATPSSLRWSTGAQPARVAAAPIRPVAVKLAANEVSDTTASIHDTSPVLRAGRSTASDDQPSGRGEWSIQIGATQTANDASELLTRAKSENRQALGSARPTTEKVQKGRATLYRARFAGLGPEQAETACRMLKRSGFACFTTRD